MGELTPQEIEKLILGYEELNPADRVVADRYLSLQPELAARLDWHQQKETAAAADLPIRDDFWQADNLMPTDEAAQEESLRRILASIDQVGNSNGHPTPPTKIISFTDRLRHQALWALPLAAILAVAIMLPRGGEEKALMQNLTVVSIELMADGSRGPDQPAVSGEALHTGQAFALDYFLKEDAYVVVYHVDPAGQVSRVYPEAITDTLSPHRGGQGHQIPGPDSDELWILGSETGTESFLIAASSQFPTEADLGNLPSDRDSILAELKSRLESTAEQVDLYEFEHVD